MRRVLPGDAATGGNLRLPGSHTAPLPHSPALGSSTGEEDEGGEQREGGKEERKEEGGRERGRIGPSLDRALEAEPASSSGACRRIQRFPNY